MKANTGSGQSIPDEFSSRPADLKLGPVALQNFLRWVLYDHGKITSRGAYEWASLKIEDVLNASNDGSYKHKGGIKVLRAMLTLGELASGRKIKRFFVKFASNVPNAGHHYHRDQVRIIWFYTIPMSSL